MDAFNATCDLIEQTSARADAVRVASAWLSALDDDDFATGALFLSGRALPKSDLRRVGVGQALIVRAFVQLTGLDAATVRAASADGFAAAMARLSVGHVASEPFGLNDARVAFEALGREPVASHKLALLVSTLRRMSPDAVKAFVRVALGDVLFETQVEEAVALATGQALDDVRRANARSGNLAQVASAARAGTLDAVRARLFHPIAFMRSSPLSLPSDVSSPADWWVERKLDGLRVQVHVEASRVFLYSRTLGDVTVSFPELVEELQALSGPLVVEGAIVAVDGSRTLSFQALQPRLSGNEPSTRLIEAVPAAFVAWDLIHDASGLVIDEPMERRRELLEQALDETAAGLIRLSLPVTAETTDELASAFESAQAAGCEGLVLKKRGSKYEAGRRGSAWAVLKPVLGTLNVVITAAQPGRGKRSDVLSAYTFAVRGEDGLVDLGEVSSGLPEADADKLGRMLEELIIERYGEWCVVRPELVLEVAFDSVQKAQRSASGYALRWPRVVRWRVDKHPFETDTLETVADLHEKTLEAGRVELKSPPTLPPPARTQRVDDLPLFENVRKPSEG